MAIGSRITLEVELGSCVNSIALTSSKSRMNAQGDLDLYLTAIEAVNENADRVRCSTVRKQFTVYSTMGVGSAEDVTLKVLN